MRFSPWHPLHDAADRAPPAPGVLQTRGDALITYPRGKSAMVLYTCTTDALSAFVTADGRALLDQAAAHGARWIRFALTDQPTRELSRLLASFTERFGAPPLAHGSTMAEAPGKGLTYRDAGVDIDAGEEVVDRIKAHVKRTFRPEVMTDLGGFAGLFAMPKGYRDPVLVSCADGVGTKLKLAFMMGQHDTVGVDLVAMNVNDMVVSGAEPLFFLDYFASGTIEPQVAEQVIAGIANGCKEAGCALLGGETAELPGFYQKGEYDLAGFAVGMVERDGRIDGRSIAAGDVLLGLASSGFHSNGYSLVRRVFLDHAQLDLASTPEGLNEPLGQALLRPTRIYVKSMRQLAAAGLMKGAAHITGGGLVENPPRMLPSDARLALRIDLKSWTPPALFQLAAKLGSIAPEEMRRTFNMGIGMVIAVAPDKVDQARALLTAAGETVHRIGEVVPAAAPEAPVEFVG